MTEKRFILKSDYDWWGVIDTTGEIKGEYNDCFSTADVVDLLNEQHEQIERLKRNFKALDEVKCELAEENEQLRREKGKLEIEIECLSDELRQCKAVINKEWSEYLKKSGDVE